MVETNIKAGTLSISKMQWEYLNLMIPPKSHPTWKLLVTNRISHNFKLVIGSVLMETLARKVQRDNSPETLSACIDDAYEFFEDFEDVFKEDLKDIFG